MSLSTNITNIALGGNYASKLYLGDTLIFPIKRIFDITYTASDKLGEAEEMWLDGIYTDSLPPIVSHEFSNGNGIITFVTNELIIGECAFSECVGLYTINLPEGTSTIGVDAFSSCSNLTSITIPDSVKTIEHGAFLYCYSLSSITLPTTITKIDNYVFYNCSALKRLNSEVDGVFNITDNITSIGDYSFQWCHALTTITIPDSVTSIGKSVFFECDHLTSVTIGKGVTIIGVNAFANCGSLTSITYNGTINDWNRITLKPLWNDQSAIQQIICTDGTITL